MFELRRYRESDAEEIRRLFYFTVHTVNAKDYTGAQLNAWAPKEYDLEKWSKSFGEKFCVVAVENGAIVGFGDIDETGCLDRLFVHHEHQNEGIGTAICDALEKTANGKITTHASITAKPFFENRGYKTVKEQLVERNGIKLKNFVMQKQEL